MVTNIGPRLTNCAIPKSHAWRKRKRSKSREGLPHIARSGIKLRRFRPVRWPEMNPVQLAARQD